MNDKHLFWRIVTPVVILHTHLVSLVPHAFPNLHWLGFAVYFDFTCYTTHAMRVFLYTHIDTKLSAILSQNCLFRHILFMLSFSHPAIAQAKLSAMLFQNCLLEHTLLMPSFSHPANAQAKLTAFLTQNCPLSPNSC